MSNEKLKTLYLNLCKVPACQAKVPPHRITCTIISAVACWLLVSVPLCLAQDQTYYSVTGPCRMQFPKDHGAHPGYQTEWWYYTGNVQSESGETFGFQLTFFRTQFSPPGAELKWPKPTSAWRAQQLFFAHATITDIRGDRFYYGEQMSREAMGMAGAKQNQNGDAVTVFVKDWTAHISLDQQVLGAGTDEFGFRLALKQKKPPVPHGESGYSLKGSSPERASCYYSITRLVAEGNITVKGRTIPVKGSAWMDHEFSSATLEPGLVGWDWFSLQLGDNTEIMIYLIRQGDGAYSKASSGTFVDASGKAVHLTRESFDVQTLDHWKSIHSGALYPSRWRLQVYPLQMDLVVTPKIKDQELITSDTEITYWEGSVSTEGTAHGQLTGGDGYVELTGYAKPLELPGKN